jgi:hypothetical protein
MSDDRSKEIKVGQTIFIIEPYKTHNTGLVYDRIAAEVIERKGSLLTIHYIYRNETHYIKDNDERIMLL